MRDSYLGLKEIIIYKVKAQKKQVLPMLSFFQEFNPDRVSEGEAIEGFVKYNFSFQCANSYVHPIF